MLVDYLHNNITYDTL